MAKYSYNQNGNLNDSGTQHVVTLVSTAAPNAGSAFRVYEISMSGRGAASAVSVLGVNRPSAIGTGAITNQVPEKFNPFSVATAVQAATAWATAAPTNSTNDILNPTWNNFGGIYRWVAPPDSEIYAIGQAAVANLDFKARTGSGNSTGGHILFEEL